MTDRTQELAEVFARLRWCVGGEFSVMLTPEMCEVLLEALDRPSRVDVVIPPDPWIRLSVGGVIVHDPVDPAA